MREQLRLTRLAGDYVALVLALSSAGERMPEPDALAATLLELLDAFTKSANAGGVPADQTEEARFALVAWADEVIQKAEWPGREAWLKNPLQAQLYRTNRAGNEFFDHLEQLRPDQLAALEVYWLVLVMGFEGQYQGMDSERRALMARHYETLRAGRRLLETTREAELTPAAYRLDIDLPGRMAAGWGIGVGVLGLGLVLALVYWGLWLALRWQSAQVPLPQGL